MPKSVCKSLRISLAEREGFDYRQHLQVTVKPKLP
jgi:hypothetical protein